MTGPDVKNDDRDVWLDDLLRAPHVDDDGFADHVAARVVPVPKKSRRAVVGFGVVAVIVGAFFVADTPALALLQTSNTLLLVVGAVIAAVGAALSGESLRLQPARLVGEPLQRTWLVPEVSGGNGNVALPASVPALASSTKVRTQPLSLDNVDDEALVVVGRVSLGRTWRSGARIVGMFCFGAVVAVFLDRFGSFVFPLMLFVSGCGALVFIVRDARATLVEEGFTADDARRLTWASVPVTMSLRVFSLAMTPDVPRAALIDLGKAVVARARLRASSARSGS